MDQWEKIEDLESRLSMARASLLESKGWHYTSNTPDSVWMWRKEHEGKVYLTSENRALSMEAHGIW